MRRIARPTRRTRFTVAHALKGRLSTRTERRLRLLLDRRRRLDAACIQAIDDLARAAVQACDEGGASRSEVAQALGVGTSTVHGWVMRGRHLRDTD